MCPVGTARGSSTKSHCSHGASVMIVTEGMERFEAAWYRFGAPQITGASHSKREFLAPVKGTIVANLRRVPNPGLLLRMSRVAASLVATVLLAAHAAAQSSDPWRAGARVEGRVLYDDNPFLLAAGRRQRLDQPSTADVQSGRYRDMSSATDVIPVAAGTFAVRGPGLRGRAVELSAQVAYEANLQNARRRHAEIRLEVDQDLPRAGRLRLRADWRPSYFSKNYLSDAVDASGDGNIAHDERVYSAGTSREIDLTLNYRHRLLKSRSARPEILAEIEVGYFARGYDAPFAGRDRRGPGAGVNVAVELNRRWTVGLEYGFESLQADPTREVMLLDETAFGVDFNGTNGVADTSARAFELVDRSRVEHNLRAAVQAKLSDAVSLELAYARRSRAFGSTQPYDVAGRDRHDRRNEFEAGLGFRLGREWRLVVAGVLAKQTTNRPGDPGSTGDVADYSRHVLSAALEYRF